MNTTPGPETITTSILHQIDADLIGSLTAYSRRGYGDAPLGADPQLFAAYGHRFPGSGRRWLDQQKEREWVEQRRREQIARGLWARVHCEMVAGVLTRQR